MDKATADIREKSSLNEGTLAAGTLATVISAVSSQFMTGDYRPIGYTLAVTNVLLLGFVATRHSWATGPLRKFLLPTTVVTVLGSIFLLFFSFAHPASAAAPAQPVPGTPSVEAHPAAAVSYTNTTNGPNSPIINGSNAPIIIGDGQPSPAKERKHK